MNTNRAQSWWLDSCNRVSGILGPIQGLGWLGLDSWETRRPVELEEMAWVHFGRLFYTLGTRNEDELSARLANESWKILTSELLTEVPTPLYCLLDNFLVLQLNVKVSESDREGQRELGIFIPSLEQRWPQRVATMFEKLAARLQELRPIKWAHLSEKKFVVEGLGKYGGPEAKDLLMPLVDDETLGRAALSALKELKRRHSAGG